ncbi:parathymosin, isoform CRA_b [Rattus norvegicus]|uniref:Parathymosin, isoform CRA_b n=1 Tax=Rattus norvegicus TaxID=10116 RepID=A6ILN0_RAT|nr:parathymosin, isoform CRA_b [Rattus norvegicus]
MKRIPRGRRQKTGRRLEPLPVGLGMGGPSGPQPASSKLPSRPSLALAFLVLPCLPHHRSVPVLAKPLLPLCTPSLSACPSLSCLTPGSPSDSLLSDSARPGWGWGWGQAPKLPPPLFV